MRSAKYGRRPKVNSPVGPDSKKPPNQILIIYEESMPYFGALSYLPYVADVEHCIASVRVPPKSGTRSAVQPIPHLRFSTAIQNSIVGTQEPSIHSSLLCVMFRADCKLVRARGRGLESEL